MFLFRSKDKTAPSGSTDSDQPARKPANLLVIQRDQTEGPYDWKKNFEGATLSDGRPINVVQVGFRECHVTTDSNSKYPIVVHLKRDERRRRPASIRPDFILIRNEVSMPSTDHRNLLLGLMMAGIPGVNTLHANYMFCERAVVQAELHRIARAVGSENFPVIPQCFFASHNEMMYTQQFPAVVKVGHAHAGLGKMKIQNHHDFEDFRSIMAMTGGKYCTAEPFIKGAYDLRIQKIGDRVRTFKRTTISGAWKTNTGSSHLETIETTDEYRRWALLAGQMFGGVDILSVDVIHCAETGREYIMEVNGGSSGLTPDCAVEDNNDIKELVLRRMNEELTGEPVAGPYANFVLPPLPANVYPGSTPPT